MFTKSDCRELIIKLGRKWFFPDFHNKLTLMIVSLGAGLLVLAPFKLAIYNWLIQTFNINMGSSLTFADVGDGVFEKYIGVLLIFIALFHNVFSKWLLNQEPAEKREEKDIDKTLFSKFLTLLPTDSRSIHMLHVHDFSNQFGDESLADIEKFVRNWNNPEYQFLNLSLEKKKMEFFNKAQEFVWLIANKSSPNNMGFQSVVSDKFRDDWNLPEWLEKEIVEVNETATDVYRQHQEFIMFVRRELKC